MKNFFIRPITCSKFDKDWYFKLPALVEEAKALEKVRIEFKPSTKLQRLFSYNSATQTLTLAESTRELVLDGSLCPKSSELVELNFSLAAEGELRS